MSRVKISRGDLGGECPGVLLQQWNKGLVVRSKDEVFPN